MQGWGFALFGVIYRLLGKTKDPKSEKHEIIYRANIVRCACGWEGSEWRFYTEHSLE